MTTTDPTTSTAGQPDPGMGTAWCVGGRRFELDAAIATAPSMGAFVVLAPDERLFLGQVVDRQLVELPGKTASVRCHGVLLAEVSTTSRPAGTLDRFETATVSPAPSSLLREWTATAAGGAAELAIGELLAEGDERVGAHLLASGFGRHTFLCGQSGSGKTYTLGIVLEQLLLHTELRLAILDPNSDYVRLDGIDASADVVSPARLADVRRRMYVLSNRAGSSATLRFRFGRFSLVQKALLLGLDALRDADEYDLLRTLTERRTSPEYAVGDLLDDLNQMPSEVARRLTLRIRNLGVADWGIWARADEPPTRDQLAADWRAVVVDLGSLPTAEERSIAAAGWLTQRWEQRHEREPVLIVIDEAHNVCPQTPTDRFQALAVEHAERIAAEGRKYGLYLLLATQSPRKIHANVLSQCENLVLMRTNSLADVAHLAEVFSHVPEGLVREAPGFRLGEGLAAGRIVAVPMLFRSGRRLSPEGGADVPTTWAHAVEPA